MDTVGFFLSREVIGSYRINEDLLEELKIIFNQNTKQIVRTGKIQNFVVSSNENGITIKDGSLSKFYQGNNIQTMNIMDIKYAIEKLSDIIHFPVDMARVMKCHFFRTIETEFPAKLYLSYFGQIPQYARIEMMNGVYYRQKSNRNQLLIYDKKTEMKVHKDKIPDYYLDKNLLKLEVQLNTNPSKVLKRSCLLGSDLYDEDVYSSISDYWWAKFSSIQYNLEMQIDFSEIKTVGQFKAAGIVALIEKAGGTGILYNQLEEARQKGELNSQQKAVLNRLISMESQSKLHTREPELVLEIQRKIREFSPFKDQKDDDIPF